MNTYNDIRTRFLNFHKKNGHAVIPSAALVPQNDPTTLFTGSGMQPLVPYLLGEKHPAGTRLANSQKSFRAEDIEEIGDNRHTTFFEMLGNWSLGDYFKAEQLPWFFEFLTNEVGLDPARLYVTVFDGAADIGVPRDDESIGIWQKLFADAGVSNGFQAIGSEAHGYEVGMQDNARVFSYDAKKNWWSRAGVPANMPVGEPGGPDSEVFYDFGLPHDTKFGTQCHPNCDCGRFMEIGNSVFMEYIKTENGFEKLKQQNVDFGGGLERIAAAQAGNSDVFTCGVLKDITDWLQKETGHAYVNESLTASFRVVADHMRAAVFLIGDGVLPGNAEQGYFVRRLIRRSVRHADKLGLQAGKLADVVAVVANGYKEHYAEIYDSKIKIQEAIAHEETKFRETIEKGMKQFEKLATGDTISGYDAFVLFTTYGFPVELTQELATERGAVIDMSAFKEEMKKHQDASRAGAEQKFKGGLADHSEATTRLHTTHHLLLKALQIVLGSHVKQRGSNITGERLRIDFSHDQKMTDDQKREVERIVNEKIKEHLPMTRSTIPREQAEKLGAEMEFGQKYPDIVSVYSLGPVGATVDSPQFDKAFSIEFCGGPHVTNTSEIEQGGVFKIQKEEASSAGIRRIKGVLVP